MSTASPWKIELPKPGQIENPISLTEIMSEELAANLQTEEEEALIAPFLTRDDFIPEEGQQGSSKSPIDGKVLAAGAADQKNSGDGVVVDEDFLLAQYLQHEFDREYDQHVQLEQKRYNQNNKISVSFEKYRASHPLEDSETSEEDEDVRESVNQAIDSHEPPTFGPTGLIKKADGSFLSKHDKVISGRKNTSRVLEFPPEFVTGDAIGMDIQLSNNVYNKLKTHSTSENKRHARLHEKKEKSTAEQSIDETTRLILFKLVNNGLLETISGSVSTGKEAVVFHAYGGSCDEQEVPAECALKVFKTTLNEFKNRSEYVKDDYRFKNPRKILKVWAEKEMLNLNRMARAQIRCPKVVKLRKHVLVMSFIGSEGIPAPKLKDSLLEGEAELRHAYDECIEAMQQMYDSCKLVHADLSEFNILYWQDHCWFIDVSQAVDLSHPRSLVFLARDCHNITLFFSKKGLEGIPNRRELFNQITGLNMESDEKFYTEVQEFQLENRSLQQRKDKSHPADCTLRKFQDEERAKKGEPECLDIY